MFLMYCLYLLQMTYQKYVAERYGFHIPVSVNKILRLGIFCNKNYVEYRKKMYLKKQSITVYID